VPLDGIPYIDFPELKLDEHESTEMPFRYVKGRDGGPVMPEVCLRRLEMANECCD
jgi:ribosome biogenesis SPOUT family RNA methylase Rps3